MDTQQKIDFSKFSSELANELDRGQDVMKQIRALGDVLINEYRLQGSVDEVLAALMSEKVGEATTHIGRALVLLGDLMGVEDLPF